VIPLSTTAADIPDEGSDPAASGANVYAALTRQDAPSPRSVSMTARIHLCLRALPSLAALPAIAYGRMGDGAIASPILRDNWRIGSSNNTSASHPLLGAAELALATLSLFGRP
jgi:hypothetical protein